MQALTNEFISQVKESLRDGLILPKETEDLLSLMAETNLFQAIERQYSFANRIYDRGRWYDENDNPEPPGTTYLGILLNKYIEVSVLEPWCDEKDAFVRPEALLPPGAILGTFEACDVLNHTPPAQNYTIYAGTRTFYFDEPLLDPATANTKKNKNRSYSKSTSISELMKALNVTLSNTTKEDYERLGIKTFHDWIDRNLFAPSNRGLELMRTTLGANYSKTWKARLLLIPVSSSNLSASTAAAVAATINRVAWQQSAHLRASGVESYSRSRLEDVLRKKKSDPTTLQGNIRNDCIRELGAIRQVILGTRPGFRKFTGNGNEYIKILEQRGPFENFFSALNTKLTQASNNKSIATKWTGTTELNVSVYIPDYLYSAPTDMVYPLYMHAFPDADTSYNQEKGRNEEVSGYTRGLNRINPLIKARKSIDKSLFGYDPAYSSLRYSIQNVEEISLSGPLLLRGHAAIQPIITKLPIFDKSVIARGKDSVSGIVAVQHLMEETLVLFKEILLRGIADEKTVTIIGKPYSSNSQIAERIRQLGINVVIPEGDWGIGCFTEWFDKKVKKIFEDSIGKIKTGTSVTQKAVLLLDDGGTLIKAAASIKSPKHRFVAVEQTSRGIAEAVKAKKKFPVVLVACSALKSIIEPEFVARAAVNKMAQHHPELLSKKNVGIIGLGNVGCYLAKYFLQRRDIQFDNLYVSDLDSGKMKDVKDFSDAITSSSTAVHCETRRTDVLKKADIVYGCTGADIGIDLLEKRKGQNLVSLSSNDVEFSTLLKELNGEKLKHFDSIEVMEKKVISGGFPITFDREISSAPLIEMQLTRALLLAGIEQVLNLLETDKSPVALDHAVQLEIWKKWQRETGTESASDIPEDPGAAAWKTARAEEQLGALGNYDKRIGEESEFSNKNNNLFQKAINACK